MAHNPFASDRAARMYAAARPDYSPFAGAVIKRLTGIDEPVACAADVGCGTGISTKALAPLARQIVGVDRSATMLRHAAPRENVSYVIGAAEALPLESNAFDLIAVGSAIHWFDRERFLEEASRSAAPGAWLVAHTHWFSGEMRGRADFGNWSREVYVRRYPTPPRDRTWRPPDDLGTWHHVSWEGYEHDVRMTAAQLVAYLMTQSNVQAVLEGGSETEDEVRFWLREQVAPFFGEEHGATFGFGGYVACHKDAV